MKVVNLYKQPYDIYIGRKNIDLGLEESIWANPFKKILTMIKKLL